MVNTLIHIALAYVHILYMIRDTPKNINLVIIHFADQMEKFKYHKMNISNRCFNLLILTINQEESE
jgi:hypothetical protein